MHRQGQGPYALRVRREGLVRHHQPSGCRDGQFVIDARVVPGIPSGEHTLANQIARTERVTGVPVERTYVGHGYRGHDAINVGRAAAGRNLRLLHGLLIRLLAFLLSLIANSGSASPLPSARLALRRHRVVHGRHSTSARRTFLLAPPCWDLVAQQQATGTAEAVDPLSIRSRADCADIRAHCRRVRRLAPIS